MKTKITQVMPWGVFTRNGHRLLCSDGNVRAASLSSTPDTFFSVPANIRLNGKTVSGYATPEALEDGQRVWCFRHHTEHQDKLPEWPKRYEQAWNELLNKAI